MGYRGPHVARIGAQFEQVEQYAGETGVWRQYVSAASGSGSAYFAGVGFTQYYVERPITGLLAAAQGGEGRFRETQLPAGQIMAGDMLLSTTMPLGTADEVIWRGTYYRIEGDSVPVHLGGRVWWRTVVRRGDVTG